MKIIELEGWIEVKKLRFIYTADCRFVYQLAQRTDVFLCVYTTYLLYTYMYVPIYCNVIIEFRGSVQRTFCTTV